MSETNYNELPTEENSKSAGFDWTKLVLPGAIMLAGVLISAAILYSNGGFNGLANIRGNSDQKDQKAEVSADDDAFLGKDDAPVVLVEFSDFQCPFCRTFWRNTLPLIKSQYVDTGKVKFVYRDFPLGFHPGAMPAAQASECAREQGKFWEMHDKIFEGQDKLGQGTIEFSVGDLKKWAGQIGLDKNKFNSCLDSQKYAAEVENDINDGQAAGVSGTPTVFVNGQAVVGAQPFSAFKALIEAELNK